MLYIILGFVQMLEYEYEPEMEESYRADFLKSFKKTVEKGFFSFIIVDAVNDKVCDIAVFSCIIWGLGFCILFRLLPQ